MRKSKEFIHEGKYAAEVAVDLIEDDTAWSPYLSARCTTNGGMERRGDLQRARSKIWKAISSAVRGRCRGPAIVSTSSPKEPTMRCITNGGTVRPGADGKALATSWRNGAQASVDSGGSARRAEYRSISRPTRAGSPACRNTRNQTCARLNAGISSSWHVWCQSFSRFENLRAVRIKGYQSQTLSIPT
jgi:hypothetical protein